MPSAQPFDRDAGGARTSASRAPPADSDGHFAVRLRESGHRRPARAMARRVRRRSRCWCRRAAFPARSRGFSAVPAFLGRRSKVDERIAARICARFCRAAALRRAALGLRRQFRARRGFVRARAMGAKTIRLANLSASRRRPPAQARRRPRALRERPCPTRRATALARFWHAWNGAGNAGLGRFLATSRRCWNSAPPTGLRNWPRVGDLAGNLAELRRKLS